MADKTLRSITFPGLTDRYVIPEPVSIDSTLSQQGKAADAKAVGDALKAQIAPAYSTSSTYAVGDLVLYNNALYRCKTAITTAEAWTPAHWEATIIGAELSQQKNAISQLDSSVYRTKTKYVLPSKTRYGTAINAGYRCMAMCDQPAGKLGGDFFHACKVPRYIFIISGQGRYDQMIPVLHKGYQILKIIPHDKRRV